MLTSLLALALHVQAQMMSPAVWSRSPKKVQFVQSTANSSYLAASSIQTPLFSSALTAGNLMVCVSQSTSGVVTSMTDTRGDTFTKIQAAVYSSYQVEMWYTITNGGTGARVTAVYSSPSAFVRLVCLDLTNNHRTLPIANANSVRQSTANVSTAIQVTQRSMTLLGFLTSEATTVNPGAGYAQIYSSTDGDLAELRAVDTTGNFSVTVSQAPAGDALLMAIAIRGR